MCSQQEECVKSHIAVLIKYVCNVYIIFTLNSLTIFIKWKPALFVWVDSSLNMTFSLNTWLCAAFFCTAFDLPLQNVCTCVWQKLTINAVELTLIYKVSHICTYIHGFSLPSTCKHTHTHARTAIALWNVSRYSLRNNNNSNNWQQITNIE